MTIDHKRLKLAPWSSLEEGSYYCENAKRYVPISHCQIGIVISIFKYDEESYPWAVLGYKFLSDIIIGPYRLRDVPDFKLYEVKVAARYPRKYCREEEYEELYNNFEHLFAHHFGDLRLVPAGLNM